MSNLLALWDVPSAVYNTIVSAAPFYSIILLWVYPVMPWHPSMSTQQLSICKIFIRKCIPQMRNFSYFIQVDYIHAVEEVSTWIHLLFNCSLSDMLIRIEKIPYHHYNNVSIMLIIVYYTEYSIQ